MHSMKNQKLANDDYDNSGLEPSEAGTEKMLWSSVRKLGVEMQSLTARYASLWCMIRPFIDLTCKAITPACWTEREKRRRRKRERLMVRERNERGRMCSLYWLWAWISLICERQRERTVGPVGLDHMLHAALTKGLFSIGKKETYCEI